MWRKTDTLTIFVLVSFLFLCFSDISEAARPKRIKIKIATLAPDGTSWMKAMRAITKYVEDNSGGRVNFQYYTGGVMGDEPDVVRKMKMGVIGGTGVSLAGVRLTVPEFQIMELPYLFSDRSFDETDYIYEKVKKYFEDAAWKAGYKLITISEAGFAHFWTKGKVDSILEEFPKQKVWQWEGEPVMEEISRSLDAATVSLPLPETLTALQTGMIDAFYGTPLHVLSFQWNKFVDTIYTPSIFYTPSFFILTKKVWEALPEDIQALFFNEEAEKIKKEAAAEIHKADDDALEALIHTGVKVVPIPEAELSEIKNKTKEVWISLSDKIFSKAFLDEAKALLSEFRHLNKEP